MKLTAAVVVCTYQGEKYLARQLKSILSQSRPVDKIYVFDDQSKDSTLDVARQALRGHPSAEIVLNPENKGYSRNFGDAVHHVGEDVIFLADQDDVWYADKVETMMRLFEADPELVLTYSDLDLVDAEERPLGHSLWQTPHFTRKIHWSVGSVDRLSAILPLYDPINGCAMAVRSSFVKRILPGPSGIGHDYVIGFFVAGERRRCHCVDHPLMAYRFHDAQVAGDRTRKRQGKAVLEEQIKKKEQYVAGYRAMVERCADMADELFKKGTKIRLRSLDSEIRHLRVRKRARDGAFGSYVWEVLRWGYKLPWEWKQVLSDGFVSMKAVFSEKRPTK